MIANTALYRVVLRLLVFAVCLAQALPALPASAAVPSPAQAVAEQTAATGLIAGEVFDASTGLPLAGAAARLVMPDGQPGAGAAAASDAGGHFRLPAAPGGARVRVSKAGYTEAERTVSVVAGEWVAPADLYLTPLDANAVTVISVVGGTVSGAGSGGNRGPAVLALPPGALASDTTVRVTPLESMALAAPLPLGWSPIAAADVSPAGLALLAPASLNLPLPPAIAAGTTLALARWDAAAGEWRSLGAVQAPPNTTLLPFEIDQFGQYAVLLPDAGTPAAADGAPLPGVAAVLPSAPVSATISPAPRILLTGEETRSRVAVRLETAETLPSGTPVELEARESFEYLSGGRLLSGPVTRDLPVFAALGAGALAPQGELLLAPSRTIAPHDLRLGAIDLAVSIAPAPAKGPLVPRTGATLSNGGVQLSVPRNGVLEPIPGRVAPFDAAGAAALLPPTLSVLSGAAVDLFGARLGLPGTLSVPAPAGVTTADQLLLVRLQPIGDETRLDLIAPAALAGGRLRAQGVMSEGRYLFVKATTPLGFVTGAVSDQVGRVLPGVLVTSSSYPLVSLSNPDGRYIVAGPQGPAEIVAINLETRDTLKRSVTIGARGTFVTASLGLSATGPVVVSTSPANNAANVPITGTLSIAFSEAIDPASVTSTALQVSDGTVTAQGSLSLAPNGLSLSFVPASFWASSTTYTATLSGALADLSGNSMGAPYLFKFSTVDVTPPPQPQPGQINATIPDETGHSTVTGTAGSADPGGLVLVRNLRTGGLTTKAPETNGSFSLLVPALRSDKLELILQDPAGNRTTLPLPPFRNADGSVVVGAEGGVVEGSGGVQAQIEPGSLPPGTVVKVDTIPAAEMPLPPPMTLSTTMPYVGGIELSLSAGPTATVTPTTYIDLSIPAPADARPDDIVFVTQLMTVTREITGANPSTVTEQVWALIDRASLKDGRYETASPPFPGAMSSASIGFYKTTNIITPGPNGELDVSPFAFSDDVYEDRPLTASTTQRVIAAGPDGVLQTQPFPDRDDELVPECVSFVNMQAYFGFQIGIFSVGLPYFFPMTSGSATIVGFCNQNMEVNVVRPDTGATVMRVTRVAPPGRNDIFYSPDVVSDDTTPPTLVDVQTPTRLFDDSEAVEIRFSERMRQSTFAALRIVDSRGVQVQGEATSIYGTAGLAFQPRSVFRLDEPYTIHFDQVKDLAGNPVDAPPLTFTRAAPQSLGELRDNSELFTALARCPMDQTKPCYVSGQSAVLLGDLLFIANGVREVYETYLADKEPAPPMAEGEAALLAVVNVRNRSAPRLVGWHETFTDPRALDIAMGVSFAYDDEDSQEQRFEGDLLVLVGGGRAVNGINLASKMEIYDVSACIAGAEAGILTGNCLEEPHYNAGDGWQLTTLKGMKFLSTEPFGNPRPGVPPDMGVALDVEVLHQQVTVAGSHGPERQDTVVAYAGVVPIGIESVDVTKAFNANGASAGRFAIDGLYRGDYFDLDIMKNGLLAVEEPTSRSSRFKVFSASLYPLDDVTLPRAFRVAAGESFAFDLDNDGNVGIPEDTDGDDLPAVGEIFDLAFVSSGGSQTINGKGELYVIDVSHLTDLAHTEPARDPTNTTNQRIISRIPLPASARAVCVDADARLAYVNLLDTGVALVDLTHLQGVVQGTQEGGSFRDTDQNGLDDRVLFIIKSSANPTQGVQGSPCASFAAGSMVMNWENTGPEFYGSYALSAQTPVRIKSDVDTVNNQVCQAAATIDFTLTHAAEVTVRVGGAVIDVPGSAVGSSLPTVPVQDLPLAAGPHSLPIPPDLVTDPGEQPFTVQAVFERAPEPIEQSASGVIIHDIVKRAAFPIGHTMIEGVDLWDGHLTHGTQDVMLPGRGPDLEFARTYSSAGTDSDSPLGAGWSHNLDVRLIRDNCGRYVVVGGEGSGNAFTGGAPDPARAALFSSGLFTATATALFYMPQLGYHSTLVRDGSNANRFDFFTKSHVRYHFEREGSIAGEVYTLRFIEDTNGNRLAFDYTVIDNDPATLDVVTDAGGRSLRLAYREVYGRKRIVEVVGEVSQVPAELDLAPNVNLKLQYDSLGNLVAVTRTTPYAGFGLNDERVERYAYSLGNQYDKHNLTGYTDPNGHTTEFVYFAEGSAPGGDFPTYDPQFGVPRHEFVKEIRKPENVTVAFGYQLSINPGVANRRTVDDPRPGVSATTYTLDAYGATTLVEGPLGHTLSMVWCTDLPLPAGCPQRDALKRSETDALGRTTTYTYDGQGNVVETTLSFGATPPDPLRPVLDSAGQPVASISTQVTYDPLFNRVTSETDPEGNTTWYCLDSPSAPPPGSPCAPTTGKTGNLLMEVDALGQETAYAYYPNGDLRTVTDVRSYVTSYALYDRFGNAARVEQPEGAWSQTVYDARSRVRELTDSFGHHTRFAYDGLDRRIKEERLDDLGDGGAAEVVQMLYLPGGQVARTTNGLGQVTEYTYDALNRKLSMTHRQVVQADGTRVDYTWAWTYDEVSNNLTETEPGGATQTHVYDALSRRRTTSVTGPGLPAQGVETFAATYDLLGNVLSSTDLHGFTTAFAYDALLRVVETTLPYTHGFTEQPFGGQAMIRQRYDLVGNPVYSTDGNGQPTFSAYDDLYRLTKVTDALGVETLFDYDPMGNRTYSENGHTGLVVTQEYDGLNRVTEVVRAVPKGGPGLADATYTTLYAYEAAENATVVTDPTGVRTRIDRDGLDRLYQSTVDIDNLKLTTTHSYDANGNLVAVRDPQGNDVDEQSAYDGLNRRIRITYPPTPGDNGQPVVETFYYDPTNNLVRHVDRRGVETRFTYDALDRQTSQSIVETISNGGALLALSATEYLDEPDGNGHFAVVTTNANGEQTVARYNSLGFVVEIEEPGSTDPLTFAYDAMNQRVATDKKGQRVEMTYDALNRPVLNEEYDAGGALRSSHATEYDAATLQVTVTDRRGNASIMQQDGLGRVVEVWRMGAGMAADYGAASVRVEAYEFDGSDNVVAQIDGLGNRTEMVYDEADRKVSETRAAGSPVENTTTYTYDRVSNLLTVKDGRAHGGAFDVQYAYDARYRRISTTNAENETVAYAYDAEDNVTRITDARGFDTVFRYDEQGQLLSVDESDRNLAGAAAGVTIYAYDAARNKIAQQDANGNLVTYKYDALNRLTDTFQHTVGGALTIATMRGADPKGAALYTAAGGDEASALHWRYEYDVNNNQSKVVDPRGQVTAIAYDYLNRPQSKSYSNVADPGLDFQVKAINATFDANSNPLTVSEVKLLGGITVTETLTLAYDAFDRVQTATRRDHDDAAGRTVAYDYDVLGNRTAVTDPDNRTVAYAYDALNRLTSVDAPSGVTTYQWWEDDLPKAITYPNGTWQDLSQPGSYDRADRLKQIAGGRTGPAAPYATFAYTYDANGNRLTQVEQQASIGGGAPFTTTYTYDPSNRLTQADYGASGAPGGQMTYTYDAVGNRLTEAGADPLDGLPVDRIFHYDADPAHSGVTFDGVNALSRIVDNNVPANSVRFEYDANLNVAAKVKGSTRWDYRYNVRDQMVQATAPGVNATFDYNADGMRVKKIVDTGSGPEELRYLYDDRSVLLEYTAGLITAARYDYGYALIARLTPNPAPGDPASQFYLLDALGSTSALADENGDLAHAYRYDAWGRTLAESGGSDNARQFTGHYRDAETGLDYFGARYYDPEIGRFTTQDSYLGQATSPPSLHRYLYANANPLRFVDPTGYASVDAANAEEGGVMTSMGSAVESAASGPRGYFTMSASGSELKSLDGWINDENPHRPGAQPVDEDAMTGAWAGDLARRWQKGLRETQAAIEEWALRDPGVGSWAAQHVTGFTFGVAEGVLDTLKLGEGLASGLMKIDQALDTYDAELLFSGVGDIALDGLRLLDFIGVAKGVTSVGKGITSLMRFGKSVATETLPGITKKYGLRYSPMSAVHPNIQDIVQHHAAENGLEIAVRAIDPVSAAVSRYTAAAGKSLPKGMRTKGKTVFGLIKDRGLRYHTDADIAWVKATRNISVSVYDKANRKYVTKYFLKGQHLTDDAVIAAVVKPLNKRLPVSMRFQHGAHFSSHTAFGGTLDYEKFGLYPGHPGPVSVHRAEGMTMLSTRQVEQYAQLGNRLPWHPSWKLEKPVPFNLGLLLQGTAQVGVPTAYFYQRGQMGSGK